MGSGAERLAGDRCPARRRRDGTAGPPAVQALDRTQPILPIEFGLTEKRTNDYVRHGTTNLLAALDVGTRQVTADCHPRRRGTAPTTRTGIPIKRCWTSSPAPASAAAYRCRR